MNAPPPAEKKKRPSGRPGLILLLCGLAMAGWLHLTFSRPFSLAQHATKAQQSFGTLSRFSPSGAASYVIGFGGAFALYALGYWFGARKLVMRGYAGRGAWIAVGAGALLANGALLPMYPADAADVFDYTIRGRLTSIYGLNPLKDAPRLAPDDPFLRYAAWRNVPSAYGAGWEIVAAGVTRLAGNDVITNVIVFKLLAVLAALGAACLTALTLGRIAPRRALSGLYLFALNPLLVFMAAGRAHNDTLMALAVAFACYCLIGRRWYVLAALGIVLGALIKFIPLLLLPFAVIALLRERRLKLAGRIVRLVIGAALGIGLVAICYAPFWYGPETLRTERLGSMYTNSVATVLRQFLMPIFDGKTGASWTVDTPVTNRILNGSTLALFAGLYLWTLWRALRTDPDDDSVLYARVAAWALLFYLLVACLWFQAWYVIWLLPLVTLLEANYTRRYTLLFSYVVTWSSLLYNWITLRPGQIAPQPWLDLVPVAAVMGTAWGYALWYALRSTTRTTPESRRIGGQLRAAREASGMTQIELAEVLGLPTDEIARYERGYPAMRLDRLARMATVLGLPASYLTGAML